MVIRTEMFSYIFFSIFIDRIEKSPITELWARLVGCWRPLIQWRRLFCAWNHLLCMTHRSFVAYAALHHMLVRLALHRYGTLTDPTADDWSAAAVRAALRGVGGWRLTWYHRAGERHHTWGEGGGNGLVHYNWLCIRMGNMRAPQN